MDRPQRRRRARNREGLNVALDLTIPAFPFPPDWSDLVNERLEFRTDAIAAMNGSEQARRTRITPRRRFEFLLSSEKVPRQAMANLAWARGARQLYLPLWTEGARLEADLGSGTDLVPVSVDGLEFAAGDSAILVPEDPTKHELVEVDSIGVGYVQLANVTAKAFGAGTFLHPVRRARFDSAFSSAAFNRSWVYGRQRFLIDEPNPFPAIAPSTSYRGFPVLDTRPAHARDPETSLDRVAYRVDDDIGLVNTHDDVGIPLYRQVHDWNLDGRPALNAWRSMVYHLNGKRNSIWVPTWLDDLTLAASMTSVATAMVVAWSGYAARIAQAVNRRDLRIQLTSGTVLYRRVLASVDNGNGTETLTLDSALGEAVTPAQVSQVSFMGLCRSDSDQFELGWWRSDYVDVTTAWRARQHDV
jgi:hypothetical protein